MRFAKIVEYWFYLRYRWARVIVVDRIFYWEWRWFHVRAFYHLFRLLDDMHAKLHWIPLPRPYKVSHRSPKSKYLISDDFIYGRAWSFKYIIYCTEAHDYIVYDRQHRWYDARLSLKSLVKFYLQYQPRRKLSRFNALMISACNIPRRITHRYRHFNAIIMIHAIFTDEFRTCAATLSNSLRLPIFRTLIFSFRCAFCQPLASWCYSHCFRCYCCFVSEYRDTLRRRVYRFVDYIIFSNVHWWYFHSEATLAFAR